MEDYRECLIEDADYMDGYFEQEDEWELFATSPEVYVFVNYNGDVRYITSKYINSLFEEGDDGTSDRE